MQNEIFKYLEFLLPIHNCVIIPDFGGFIVNITPFNTDSDNGSLPRYNIVFNPELKHDDGIIASCLSKNENLSYNVANKEIKDAVKLIYSELKSGKPVVCANIGILSTDNDGNVIFRPNKNIVHPALYGLSPVRLQHLSCINKVAITNKDKKVSTKYLLSGVAATIAAMFLFTTPVNIGQEELTPSKASFIPTFVAPITTTTSVLTVDSVNNNTENMASVTENVIDEEVIATPTRSYYIIIGGEEDRSRAEKLLSKFKETDFPNAAIIESSDRYRIYVSSFTDKKEAETYLESFRKENVKYETAWLFSKRNK